MPCAEDLHAWLSSGIPTNPHDFVLAEGGLSVDSAAPIALPSALNVQDCIVVPSLSTTGCMVMDAVSGYGAVFDGTQFGSAFLTYQDAPVGTAILNDDLDYMVVAKDIATQEITWADIVFWFPLRWDADNRQMACMATQTGNILFAPPGVDPFGGAGSGLFEGASYLSVDCENFAGTEEWTLRFWYKPDPLNINDLIYNSRSGSGTGLNGIDIYATLAATTESLSLLPQMSIDAGVWHYVVFVYLNNTLSRYVDGVFSGSATVDLGPHSPVATIGGSPHGNIGYLHGRLMDAVFATKAITDFTVPAEPFSPG